MEDPHQPRMEGEITMCWFLKRWSFISEGKITYDEVFTDKYQHLKSATKDDFDLNDQLQVMEETLEKSNDFPKEGDGKTMIDIFGTTFNFSSSV